MIIALAASVLASSLASVAISHLSGGESAKPQCSNGFDDDSDGKIDYPADSRQHFEGRQD